MLAPIEAEPAHVALDGVDIFLLFLGRIGVVETQMTAAAEFLGDAEIQADRLGVADMEIAVRLGRKAGDHRFDAPGIEIGLHDVADEIAPRLPACSIAACRISTCLIVRGHASSIPSPTNDAAYAMTCRSAQCQLR